jgi:hypothetical protein
MEKIIEIAASVSTPLALGGLMAAIFFFVLKQILAKNVFPRLSRDHSAAFLTHVVDRLFILALVAMVLGFAGYVVVARTPRVPEQVKVPDRPDTTKAPETPKDNPKPIDAATLKPISLKIEMTKGGTRVPGREDERVGEGHDGVVTSISIQMENAPHGLTLKMELFGMTDTGHSDGHGPIMRANWNSETDATSPPNIPKGIRAIKIRLDGPQAKFYEVRYEVSLTSGLQNSGTNGSVAGDQTELTSSLQHQLIWLKASIVPGKHS